MKTSDLTGAALDWAVAKALGIRAYIGRYEHTMTGPCILDADLVDMDTDGEQELKFSRDWAQGGPIIEREIVSIDREEGGRRWKALAWRSDLDLQSAVGPTPLIAAMRCYVASKLGDEVDVPEGLV